MVLDFFDEFVFIVVEKFLKEKIFISLKNKFGIIFLMFVVE